MRYGNSTMRLFGGFELRCDDHLVDTPQSVHRLLGFLAVHDRPLPRGYVAATLWPDTTDCKANANLRTGLWRVQRLCPDLVKVTSTELALNPTVSVDVRTVHEAARQFRRLGVLPQPDLLVDIHGELLPGCWDSWLIFERERLRQEAVELLEAASRASQQCGQMHYAMMLCLGAIECDAFRESANLLLIELCLLRGDRLRAIRHASAYAEKLEKELGLPPPSALKELLDFDAAQRVL